MNATKWQYIPAQGNALGKNSRKKYGLKAQSIEIFIQLCTIIKSKLTMSQSLSKLYVHIIFHVKNTSVLIRPEDESELYAYMGGIIKQNSSCPIKINGTENHIHVLSTMSKNISLANFIEEIKKNSSRWIKTKGEHYRKFAWQSGYSGYSVSQSKVLTVEKYIEGQKEHHKKVTFHEEYLQFLKEYSVDFNESFLWT